MKIPDIETCSQTEIKKYQEGKLLDALAYLNKFSPFYKKIFKENRIDISRITTLDDLNHIPPTTKDDLQNYNMDFFCVDKNKIIDYVTTSGTSGEPVTYILTEMDLQRLAYNEALSLSCANGTRKDIYQLMTTIDRRFMAGLAYFMGVRKMGAGVVRVGNGMPDFQWDSIKRIHPTILITVPSFLIKIIEYAEENGINYKSSSVKKAICIGDALRNSDFSFNSLGRRISERWGIKLFSTYASTEMATAFSECIQQRGGHHHPELIITEFLDENGRLLQNGEAGELTITSLGVHGMPLLRFRTGDICQPHYEPCACGRTTMRLGPVIGRKQQMIKYKGTTFYPSALFDILNDMPEIVNYYIEVFSSTIGVDELVFHIGLRNSEDDILEKINERFRKKLRLIPKVIYESILHIDSIIFKESKSKAKLFFDNRS